MLVVLEAAIRKKEIARWIPFESSWFPPSCCRCLHHPHRELAGNGRSNPGNRVVEKRRGRISRSFFLKEFFFGMSPPPFSVSPVFKTFEPPSHSSFLRDYLTIPWFAGGLEICSGAVGSERPSEEGTDAGCPSVGRKASCLWCICECPVTAVAFVPAVAAVPDWGLVTAWNLASEVIVAAPAAG
ncbi:hypothetical protein MLD38_035253 [Melastoma candidum]|uniref:Uncharacterized protein n=1 Tax=Melastoma candidum TaxID=119954 RepID=A0ACB9MDR6_9MYRT|nr:hypothetical protein MLD38_035253 [Melastoma candidum]